MPEDRVERKYHPDGSLAEEIHYRGTLEHGTWRTWHSNGQLSGEYFFDLGAYMNGTNRTWGPDGTLLSEHTYVDGHCTSSRLFTGEGKLLHDSAITDRALIRKLAACARRAKAIPVQKNPKPKTPTDLPPSCAESLPWLRKSSAHTLGEFDHATSIELIETLHDLGSPSVFAALIKTSPGTADQSTNYLLIGLPEDPEARARVLAFANAYKQEQGFDAEPDPYEAWMFLLLC